MTIEDHVLLQMFGELSLARFKATVALVRAQEAEAAAKKKLEETTRTPPAGPASFPADATRECESQQSTLVHGNPFLSGR